jgi:ssDNA-binding Zn-finger/Zn-ribbon topoisomerase 1
MKRWSLKSVFQTIFAFFFAVVLPIAWIIAKIAEYPRNGILRDPVSLFAFIFGLPIIFFVSLLLIYCLGVLKRWWDRMSGRQPVTPQYPPVTSPVVPKESNREALKHIGLWPEQVFKPRTVDFRLNENDSPQVKIGKVIASGRCPECGHKQLLESPPSEGHIIAACNIPTCESVFDFDEAIPWASQSRLPAYAALRARLDGRTSERQPAAPQQKAPPPQPAILKAIPQQPAIPQQKAQARAGGGDAVAIKAFEQDLAAAKARLSTPPLFSGL